MMKWLKKLINFTFLFTFHFSNFSFSQTLQFAPAWKGAFADFFDDDFKNMREPAKEQIETWLKEEDFAERWNLKHVLYYNQTPNKYNQKRYVENYFLKYIDRKLLNQHKDAKVGSSEYSLIQARKAMTPKGQWTLLPSFRLKLRAKVLQGQGIILLENPFLAWQVHFDYRGRTHLLIEKDFEMINFNVRLEANNIENEWKIEMIHHLNDLFFVSYSSIQKWSDHLFTHKANQRAVLGLSNEF